VGGLVAPFTTFRGGVVPFRLPAGRPRATPCALSRAPGEAILGGGGRSTPGRPPAGVRSRSRDTARRRADMEMYYTSRNTRLADEIDSLR